MRYAILYACFCLLFPHAIHAQSSVLEGTAIAVDGDTLDFSGMTVDIAGVDAPEEKQTCLRGSEVWQCGSEARGYLQSLVAGHSVICQTYLGSEGQGLVASCRADDQDIGLALIEAGLVIATDAAADTYRAAQKIRQDNRFGLWASDFEMPAQWRSKNPGAAPRAKTAAGSTKAAQSSRSERTYRNEFGCAIKGNRSIRGDWIYHLPGMRYYDSTRPEELFCTESQAVTAGYRRSKE